MFSCKLLFHFWDYRLVYLCCLSIVLWANNLASIGDWYLVEKTAIWERSEDDIYAIIIVIGYKKR